MVQKPGDSSGTAEAVSTVESSVNFRFSSRELSPYFQAQNEPCRLRIPKAAKGHVGSFLFPILASKLAAGYIGHVVLI